MERLEALKIAAEVAELCAKEGGRQTQAAAMRARKAAQEADREGTNLARQRAAEADADAWRTAEAARKLCAEAEAASEAYREGLNAANRA